mgnify:CR=1 FL=1
MIVQLNNNFGARRSEAAEEKLDANSPKIPKSPTVRMDASKVKVEEVEEKEIEEKAEGVAVPRLSSS